MCKARKWKYFPGLGVCAVKKRSEIRARQRNKHQWQRGQDLGQSWLTAVKCLTPSLDGGRAAEKRRVKKEAASLAKCRHFSTSSSRGLLLRQARRPAGKTVTLSQPLITTKRQLIDSSSSVSQARGRRIIRTVFNMFFVYSCQLCPNWSQLLELVIFSSVLRKTEEEEGMVSSQQR